MKPKTGPHHFSDCLHYDFQGHTAMVTPKQTTSEILRITEVWGLAYYNWLKFEKDNTVEKLIFDISHLDISQPEKEAFKRRISYLNFCNDLELEIKDQESVKLYTQDELVNRPANEIVISELKKRSNKDLPGRLEKDFQVFLFGGSIIDQVNTEPVDYKSIYRRLGVLGWDFYKLEKNFKIMREFPTGVFDQQVLEQNRLLPTYFIDIVAFNKLQELSIIELKLNDTKLQVISQLLDYALFALSYLKQIKELMANYLGRGHYPEDFIHRPISCYVANNYFHPRFDDIARFYSPEGKGMNLKFKKIIIGETKLI